MRGSRVDHPTVGGHGVRIVDHICGGRKAIYGGRISIGPHGTELLRQVLLSVPFFSHLCSFLFPDALGRLVAILRAVVAGNIAVVGVFGLAIAVGLVTVLGTFAGFSVMAVASAGVDAGQKSSTEGARCVEVRTGS